MPRKNDSESSEPLADGRDRRIAGTAMASPITRGAEKWRRVGERDGWGRLSVDGPGHYNPDRSEGPWGRAVKPLARRCHSCALNLDTERGLFRRQGGTKDGCKPRDAMIRRHQGRPPPIRRPWSRTGENPPYGILGRTMETSASFEARSAPSSHPTIVDFALKISNSPQTASARRGSLINSQSVWKSRSGLRVGLSPHMARSESALEFGPKRGEPCRCSNDLVRWAGLGDLID